MKDNAGFIALITVALAFLGVSSIPWSTPRATPGAEQSAKGKQPATTAKGKSLNACDEIQKRIRPFIHDPGENGWALPTKCYENEKVPAGLKPGSTEPQLRFLIATVPNPISTHLPLMFDRMVEVIQGAARDEGYSYNSSWFPWDEGKEYSSLSDQLTAEKVLELEQAQPGIVTFRRSATGVNSATYQNGLIVLVVSEQPTGGIDEREFENALAWIGSVSALEPSRHLQILGPVFSGSLPSLKQALGSGKLDRFENRQAVDVFSGSISGESSYAWFHAFIEGSNFGMFRTMMEGDSRMIGFFCRFIKRQNYRLDRVAVLSEDETAFGEGPRQEPCYDPESKQSPIHISYPRDIATLRSAYQEQSLLGPAKPQGSSGSSSNSLRGDLSEPANNEHDTVRSYGGQLTPLAQESLLVGVTDLLRAKRIEFVVLRSTNTLDQIFLAQFLRRAYPDARIVIDGADQLFRRGGEGSSLRGVLLLSSYPLLVSQQDWTPTMLTEEGHTFPVFAEDVVEGEYIAARQLIGNSSTFIGNYAPPAWAQSRWDEDDERAATWVSVIGHHQFWPVAVLNETTLHPDHKPTEPSGSLLERKEVYPNGDASPLGIEGGLQVILIGGLLWGAIHLQWCRKGSVAPSTSFFRKAYFAPIDRKEHAALIAMGSLLPALAVVVTGSASGLMTWSLQPWAGWVVAVWAVSVAVLGFWACKDNYALATVSAAPQPEERKQSVWRRQVGVAALAFFLFVLLLYAYMTRFSSSVMLANRLPAYWRSVHLLSGVSPLLPQILLLAGMYCWFWFALRGLALFGDDRPLLPKKRDLTLFSDIFPVQPDDKMERDDDQNTPLMPMFSREEAGDRVESEAVPWGKKHRVMLALASVAAFCIFGLSLQDYAVRTLGEKAFGVTIFFWIVVCMGFVLSDGVQMWSTWKELHVLLIYLDRLPLRRTLASLKGLSWGSVVSMSGNTLGERYRVLSRQLESLRHLSNRLSEWSPKEDDPTRDEKLVRKERVLNQLKECQKKVLDFAMWFVKLRDSPTADLRTIHAYQEELAASAGLVMRDILQPAWQQEKKSLIIKLDANKDNDGDRTPSFDTKDVEEHVLAAEEFFVLPYLGFVQNVLGRIRTMILGSLLLFVATTFAVASYPFDPMPRLGGAFLIVFLITGGIVIVVYAQMNRDTTLSYITNTSPGKLGGQFWLQIITFGIGPTLGLLTTLFPSITDFVGSWLQPSMQALK